MKRNYVLAGLILLLVAATLYFVSYLGESSLLIRGQVYLLPGGSAQIPFNFGQAVITYSDGRGIPLSVKVLNGSILASAGPIDGYFSVIVMGSREEATIVNNYTSPLSVKYVVVSTGSLTLLYGVMSLLSILFGIVGVVLIVLGVLRGRKNQ